MANAYVTMQRVANATLVSQIVSDIKEEKKLAMKEADKLPIEIDDLVWRALSSEQLVIDNLDGFNAAATFDVMHKRLAMYFLRAAGVVVIENVLTPDETVTCRSMLQGWLDSNPMWQKYGRYNAVCKYYSFNTCT